MYLTFNIYKHYYRKDIGKGFAVFKMCCTEKKKKLSTEKTSYNLLYFLCMMKLSPGDVNPLS